MPSPFPGVDPFIEGQGVWADFHHIFIGVWREMLMRKLPPHYVARVQEHVYLDRGGDEFESERIERIPDVEVERVGERGEAYEYAEPLITMEPKMRHHVMGDPVREGYIELRRKADDSVVAVLELLSPTNKRGVGRGEYLVKRDELLHRPVHLVEVDLLLRGTRMPLREKLPPGHYFAMVSRADRRPQCAVYAWTLRDRLPVIPIPLEVPDPDLLIDLQEVFTTTFDRGPYDRLVRYDQPLGIRLAPELQRWVDERVNARRG
jgi:hypothetical protein